MIIHNVEQRTPEWLYLKKNSIGGSTASEFKPKVRGSGYRAGFYEMLADDVATEHEGSAMNWGTNTEPLAVAKYEEVTGNKVEHFGIWEHDKYSYLKYSPDGGIRDLNGDIGTILEIKCPSTKVYCEYIINLYAERVGGKLTLRQKFAGLRYIPEQYREQVIHGFIVNERATYCHFFIFNPTIEKETAQWILVTINRYDIMQEIEDQLMYELNGYQDYLQVKQLFTDF